MKLQNGSFLLSQFAQSSILMFQINHTPLRPELVDAQTDLSSNSGQRKYSWNVIADISWYANLFRTSYRAPPYFFCGKYRHLPLRQNPGSAPTPKCIRSEVTDEGAVNYE